MNSGPSAAGTPPGSDAYVSRFSFTALASRGSPSWNLTLGRSAIVHCVKFAFGVTDRARYGTGRPLLLGTVSVS